MSRVATKLSCTQEQALLVERAKIVLACLPDKHNDQVATDLDDVIFQVLVNHYYRSTFKVAAG